MSIRRSSFFHFRGLSERPVFSPGAIKKHTPIFRNSETVALNHDGIPKGYMQMKLKCFPHTSRYVYETQVHQCIHIQAPNYNIISLNRLNYLVDVIQMKFPVNTSRIINLIPRRASLAIHRRLPNSFGDKLFGRRHLLKNPVLVQPPVVIEYNSLVIFEGVHGRVYSQSSYEGSL